LIEQFREYLLQIAHQDLPRQLRQKLGSSDVVQAATLDALAGFATFRGSDLRSLKAWLRSILRRNLIDAVRHFQMAEQRMVKREVPLADDNVSPGVRSVVPASPSNIVSHAEQAVLVERAISRLPKVQREVIYLRSRDGLSYGEIGERLGRSPEAVRKLWGRAIARLQAQLLRLG
jgi:RNA polymerase sigma-70 factor (ECF subfamily)